MTIYVETLRIIKFRHLVTSWSFVQKAGFLMSLLSLNRCRTLETNLSITLIIVFYTSLTLYWLTQAVLFWTWWWTKLLFLVGLIRQLRWVFPNHFIFSYFQIIEFIKLIHRNFSINFRIFRRIAWVANFFRKIIELLFLLCNLIPFLNLRSEKYSCHPIELKFFIN